MGDAAVDEVDLVVGDATGLGALCGRSDVTRGSHGAIDDALRRGCVGEGEGVRPALGGSGGLWLVRSHFEWSFGNHFSGATSGDAGICAVSSDFVYSATGGLFAGRTVSRVRVELGLWGAIREDHHAGALHDGDCKRTENLDAGQWRVVWIRRFLLTK